MPSVEADSSAISHDDPDFGVLVLRVWREDREHGFRARITRLRSVLTGGEHTSVVASPSDVEVAVHAWLEDASPAPVTHENRLKITGWIPAMPGSTQRRPAPDRPRKRPFLSGACPRGLRWICRRGRFSSHD